MDAAPYVMLYLTSAVVALALSVYGGRRWRYREIRPFVFLMAAIAFWSFCHAFSAGGVTLATTLLWAQAQYAGIVLVAPLWLLYALVYAGRARFVTRGRMVALFLIPALALAAVLTNGWHGLWWPSVALNTSRAFGSLDVTRGPLFWIHALYGYVCVLAGLCLFVRAALDAPPFYQTQARLVVLGALFPVLGNVLHLLGMQIDAVDDPTPFLFLFSGLTFYYASLRYQLLDLKPVAQREVFESIPDGVVVLDPQNRVVTHNAAAPPLLRLDTRDWTGHDMQTLAAASPLDQLIRGMLAETSAPTSRQATYHAADGLHSVELRLQPMLTRQGARAGALLLLRDVSDRVRAEHARDQRLGELQLLSQTAQAINAAMRTDDVLRVISEQTIRALDWERIGVGLLQPDGTSLRVIMDLPQQNAPTLEGQIGNTVIYPFLTDVLTSGQEQLVSIDDPAIAHTKLQRLMQRLSLRTLLALPLQHQAKSIGVLIISSTRDRGVSPDELRLFTTISTLISEAIIRTSLYEEAQHANEVKSVFLASVSHELRTPLTSILGFTEMFKLGVFGPLPKQIEEPLEHIRHSSQSLSHLINDLLDFSRMEAGHLRVDLFPVDLVGVIQAVAGAMQPQIYERGLALQVDVPEHLPLVRANSMRIEQVLRNLLANAVKFTEHGSIRVHTAHHGTEVRFSVQDTGIGIAPEQQQHIFQAFRQIESEHTRRFGGAGLGLAISKRLVELMGGTLTVESAPGTGSVFSCTLLVAHEQHLDTSDDFAAPVVKGSTR